MIPVDPSGCAPKILDVFGQTGAAWLERLPALLAEAAARWSLTILPPFPVLSYNYVAPVIGPGGAALVLKAGVPHRELSSEIAALEVFAGRGISRLVAADADRGLLLLERVLPGDSLWTVADDDARVAVVAGVLAALGGGQELACPTCPTLARLAGGFERLRATFDGGTGPFPAARVERAAALFRELIDPQAARLIHGDLNPGNVLRAGRAPWLAIDPKGYLGDPLWDVATFLNDPPPGLAAADLRRLQGRRVALLAEALGRPRQAILAWAEAHAVLSAWWSYEDHGRGYEAGLALAGIYAGLNA